MLPVCAELPPERGRTTRVMPLHTPLPYRDGPRPILCRLKAMAVNGRCRFRHRGSLGDRLMATLLFSQRQCG